MSVLRRALTGAFATALATTALTAVAPSAAAFSDDCPYEASTRLVTAQGREVRVWVYEQSDQWNPLTFVCFKVGGVVGGSFHVHGAGVVGDPPSLRPDLADENCPTLVDVEDPVTVVVEAGLVCVGFGNDAAFALRPSLPLLSIDQIHLYLDGGSTVSNAICTATPALCAYGYPYIEVL